MKLLDISITQKTIRQQVEHEITVLAKRRADQQGTPLYDQIVLDADHYLLFRSYFHEAAAQIAAHLTAYTKHQHRPLGEDTPDITGKDEDFFITLTMPDTFPHSTAHIIHNTIYGYITAWIIYRWLETKLPQEALLFRQKAEEKRRDLNFRLEIRTVPVRRPYRLY